MPVQARAGPARWAQRSFFVATLCAGALLFFEGGLYAFAVGLVLSSLLQLVAGRTVAAASTASHILLGLTALMTAVVALAALSAHQQGLPLRVIDNTTRLLLLPWCAWLALRSGVSRTGVWSGAMVGIVAAFVVACWQSDAGLLRAGGKGNPLVFANLVLVLLAIALFATPTPMTRRTAVACGLTALLAGIAIALSGSRGSLLVGWLLCACAFVHWGGAHGYRRRLAWVVAASLLWLAVLALLPALHVPLRVGNIAPDLARFARGDADTPIGARLQFLQLAWQSLQAHPWQGVGIEGFGAVVDAWPGCQRQPRPGLCELRHAHNDVAQWGATLGWPGVVALLALYGVPLTLFIRIIRRAGSPAQAQAACAGAALVAVYVLCGLTQSMFAHAATASAYALFVGVLLGIALRDDLRARHDP